jgi:hypothetical protein
MNIQDKNLKSDVMKRVLFIYGVKRLPSVFLPKFAILASIFALTGFSVSLPNVIKNMPSLFETQKFVEFMMSAFLNTRFVVQAFTLVSLVVLFYMARDLVKTLRGNFRPAVIA